MQMMKIQREIEMLYLINSCNIPYTTKVPDTFVTQKLSDNGVTTVSDMDEK